MTLLGKPTKNDAKTAISKEVPVKEVTSLASKSAHQGQHHLFGQYQNYGK
jgi:hypothetical protein